MVYYLAKYICTLFNILGCNRYMYFYAKSQNFYSKICRSLNVCIPLSVENITVQVLFNDFLSGLQSV